MTSLANQIKNIILANVETATEFYVQQKFSAYIDIKYPIPDILKETGIRTSELFLEYNHNIYMREFTKYVEKYYIVIDDLYYEKEKIRNIIDKTFDLLKKDMYL